MINLLPPTYRKKIREQQSLRLVLILGVILSITLVALSTFLVIIQLSFARERFMQESKLASFQEKTVKENSTLSEIKSWNSTLWNIEAFKEERRVLKEVFDKVGSRLPKDLSLSSFSYTPAFERKRKNDEVLRVPATLAVTGKAPNREQLLSFKDALQADPFFAEVVFPPSNWVKPKDITFSFQAKLRNKP